jgi:hypothetical protein
LHNITCTQIDIGEGFVDIDFLSFLTSAHLGNANSAMTGNFDAGTLQPDGRLISEPRMNVQHVADTVVHIAGLPNDVTMLEVNIM